MDGPESELESFRKQWQEEVSARLGAKAAGGEGSPTKRPPRGPGRPPKRLTRIPQAEQVSPQGQNNSDDVEMGAFHDPEDKEALLMLGNESKRPKDGALPQDPSSALEHYEKAVEKEAEGRLGDSVSLYRKALRLDSRAHEIYKNKHFPPSTFTSTQSDTNALNVNTPVSGVNHFSPRGHSTSIPDLVETFASHSISPAPPETSLSPFPPCPIAAIPEEILREIYLTLAIADVASFARLAQVCKRLAFLVSTDESVWKVLSLGKQFGVAAMHYSYACDLQGNPLISPYTTTSEATRPALWLPADLTPNVYLTYLAQFRHRPRIRFNGCYISTVNYTRPGVGNQSQLTWTSPIHIVTYYRYLRFFRDGTVISLLSVTEPADVVHHLLKENLHDHHGALPSAVMKDALRGRWRLSGNPVFIPVDNEEPIDADKGPGEYTREHQDLEEEGDVFVETEGVVPKYMWKMQFAFGSSGRKHGPRNNKLSWKGFWSYNRLTDDWGEFRLKNDRAFYWSRVKSYGTGE